MKVEQQHPTTAATGPDSSQGQARYVSAATAEQIIRAAEHGQQIKVPLVCYRMLCRAGAAQTCFMALTPQLVTYQY